MHPEPLPDPGAAAHRGMPDAEGLRIRAAELEHPLLQPLSLDLSDGLSPGEAAVIAVLLNPRLQEARDARGEAEAQLLEAGLLPDPVLSLDARRPFGNGSGGKKNAVGLGLEMNLEQVIGRDARKAEASASLRAVDLEIAWKEWKTAQAARLAAARIPWLRERRRLLQEAIAFQDQTVALLEAGVAKGDVPAPELTSARMDLKAMERREEALALEAMKTRSRLFEFLGVPPEAALEVEPARGEERWRAVVAPPDTLLQEALSLRLDLQALRRGYEAQEARVRRAWLARFPSLSIGVTGERDEDALKFLGGFVSIGLPVFDRGRGKMALAEASRTRLRHAYLARIAEIRALIDRLVRADGLRAQQVRTVDEAVALAEKREAAAREAYRSGDVDRRTWQEARSRLDDLRLQRAALLQARREGRIALDAAVGRIHAGEAGGARPPKEEP